MPSLVTFGFGPGGSVGGLLLLGFTPVGPSAPPNLSLLNAVQRRWAALDFTNLVGPLGLRVKPKSEPPYVIISFEERHGLNLHTNTSQRDDLLMIMHIYAETEDEAAAGARLVNGDGDDGNENPTGFSGFRFRWDGGYATRAIRTKWVPGEAVGVLSLSTKPLHYVFLTYRLRTKGNR